jgi:hypothetical protein
MPDRGPRKIGIEGADRIFMKVGNFTFRVRQGEFTDENVPVEERTIYTEAADRGAMPLWLGFTKAKGSTYIELTSMTTDEFDAFEKGMLSALAAAREVIAWLDKEAITEYDEDGDAVIPLRAIKQPPVVVHREIRPLLGVDGHPLLEGRERKQYDQSFVD